MTRTLTTRNANEIVKQTTRPIFLVELMFGTPLRLSSRGNITMGGGSTYLSAGLKVNLSGTRVVLFNENFQYTATFIAGTAGIVARVYQLYGEYISWDMSDADMLFSGEIGRVAIGTNIDISLREIAPLYSPRVMITPPLCNNLPPDGFLFNTPTGTYRITKG